MSTTFETTPHAGALHDSRSWLSKGRDWLDARGKGAWIATMILGFILFWPLGLALLGYMIWSNRMFTSKSCPRPARGPMSFSRSTGNSAFDAYRADTLRRLEEEQENFEAFLARLREAKDKSEFDAFMKERAERGDAAGEAQD